MDTYLIRKQSRENKNKKKSLNQYHKDYFIYDEEIDDLYNVQKTKYSNSKKEYIYIKKDHDECTTQKYVKECPVKTKYSKSKL